MMLNRVKREKLETLFPFFSQRRLVSVGYPRLTQP